ncbi:hypothetical protein [Pedobacter sp. SYSU D00535]|uniref:hypothetical protein n=1 Tax=Pedobacter sp. SYSU D00535 TaxID=2810308 RepID=UPI001A95ECCD|nr:hypothetical protein [Pedobacter sp. SYSU D00535]
MKTPKKKPSMTKNATSGAKTLNLKPADSKANKNFIDDDDDLDVPLDDLGGLDDFSSFDDDDDDY